MDRINLQRKPSKNISHNEENHFTGFVYLTKMCYRELHYQHNFVWERQKSSQYLLNMLEVSFRKSDDVKGESISNSVLDWNTFLLDLSIATKIGVCLNQTPYKALENIEKDSIM